MAEIKRREENKIQKTKIEWVKNPDGTQGYTWNPITGCLNHVNGLCKGGGFPCYAYRLAHGRLKERYLDNKEVAITGFDMVYIDGKDPKFADPFYPRFWTNRLYDLRGEGDYDKAYPTRNAYHTSREKEKGIFVCDMSDLFGIGIPEDWTRQVLEQCKIFSQHRFYLLTKQPQNLIKFSPFPDWCYVGVTVTRANMLWQALKSLADIGYAKVKYISFEPLLEGMEARLLEPNALKISGINWLIISSLTGTMTDLLPLHHKTGLAMVRMNGNRWSLQPQIEWVAEIVEAADKAGIPVFLKDNLNELFISYESLTNDIPLWAYEDDGATLRQEMPDG